MKIYTKILGALIDAHELLNPKIDRDRFERRLFTFGLDHFFGVNENQLEVRYAMVDHSVDYSYQHTKHLTLQEELTGFGDAVRKAIAYFKKTQREGSADWDKLKKEWFNGKEA